MGGTVGSSPRLLPLLQLVGSAVPSDETGGGVQGGQVLTAAPAWKRVRLCGNVGMTEPSVVLVSKVCCVPFLF